MISSRRTIFLALSLWCLFFTVASAKNNDSEYLDNETSVGDDMENERSIEGNRKLRKPQRTPEQLSKMFQVYTNWFFAIGDHQNLYFFNLNISSNDGRYNLVGNISLHDLYVMYMGGRDDSTKFTKLGNTEEKSTIVVLESLTGVLYLFKHLQVALCKVYKLTGVIDFVIRGDYIYYITGHSANNKLTLYRSRHAFDQYETTVFDTIMLTSTFVDDVSTSKVAVSADGTKRAIAYFVANKLCVLINSDEVNKRNITIARDRAVLFASRTHMYTFKLKNNYNVTGTDSGFIDRTCLPKDFSYSRNDGIVGSLICGDRLYDYEANVTESNTIYLELVPRPEDVVVRTKLDMPDSTLLSVSLTIDSPCDDSNTGNKDLTFRMNHTYSAAATPLVTKHRIFGNIVCDIRASNLLFQYELLRTSEYYMDMVSRLFFVRIIFFRCAAFLVSHRLSTVCFFRCFRIRRIGKKIQSHNLNHLDATVFWIARNNKCLR